MSLRQNLWEDDLTQVDIRPRLSVTPDTSIGTAIETMREARAGELLICQGDDLRGIFTERDYVKRVLNADANLDDPISGVMTPDPVTAAISEPIGAVIRTMFEGHYRHLPVVDQAGKPVGTVSVKRIVEYLVDHFPETVYNLPPQPRQVQGAREGA